jgi:outer membrane protein assembly factor BamE (lipoprotein component of BamABCDE complex)
MKAVLAILLCAVLVGCMSAGVEVKPEQTSDVRPGVTTRDQVISRLGAPTSTSTLPDGSTMLVYSFVAARARPASFIPIVGAFVSGADSRSSMVSFQFTPDGILKGSSSSATQSGAQLGTTTTDAPMQTDQPRQVQ